MKKYVTLNIDYAGGESRLGNSACDYMLIDELPDDAPADEIYAEVNPEEVEGEGHYVGDEDDEDREWVFDDECASEPILFQMIAERAREIGYEVLYCGRTCDCPEDLRKIDYFRPENINGRIMIVGYDVEEE